jgi:transcriptional regulator with GAF, ATPase, and Fis domain
VAEKHRLGPQLVTALTNYAAACHQLGDWGRALEAYERGVRMASALGMVSNRNTLAFNLARTYADIGQWERAEHHGLSTLDDARSISNGFLEASAQTVLAEASLAQGEQRGAAKLLESARTIFDEEKSPRELVETVLQLLDIDLNTGDLASARAWLDQAEDVASELGAPDIVARCTIARSHLLLARGETSEALTSAEEAARLAESVGQRKLSAEAEGALALAYDELGSSFLAERHRNRGLAHWERIAASLPEHLRDTFFRHPLRASVRSENRRSRRTQPERDRLDEEVRSLRRFVQVSRRLNSATTRDEVVESAMDAAIELTGAERGFLILVEGVERRGRRRLRVAVARNVDREKVGKAHLKFSRGISEQVIQTAEPVLTVDAALDPRFSTQRSVHAMRLKSVACVPIDSPEGVLGAIYLDNRFQSGGFDERDVNLLLAFSDTVAVALTKASVHDELVRRTRELEAERQRAEALMASQAQHIDELSHQLQERRQMIDRQYDYSAIVASSSAMERVFDLLDRVVPSELTVLIEGESGTGKELVARAIHWNGPRSNGPFVPVNCGALTETLLESELFGYRRGAFTGATSDHAGLFESASGGTLFLDEIGETSPTMQVKLLRALQDGRVRPVGSNEHIPVDVRLICATNRNLAEEVDGGRFRQDLYYRLAVVTIEVPPLRQRAEDIPAISERLLDTWAKNHRRSVPKLDPRALRRMLAHRWPGNVRELENVLARACLMSDGKTIGVGDLDLPSVAPDGRPLRGYRPGEAARMQSVLEATGWNVSEAARTLGMPRATFYRKLKRYRIDRP